MKSVLSVAFVSLAMPAFATPPDVISVNDTVFAVSETHVFLMRETSDNMGLYVSGKVSVHLVAKPIAPGGKGQIWPVYRTDRAPDYELDDKGLTEGLTVEPLEGAVNPYDILAEYNARLVSPGQFSDDDSGRNGEVSWTADALTVSYEGAVAHEMSTDAVMAQFDADLRAFADVFETYDRFAPIETVDVLYQQFTSENCRTEAVGSVDPLLHLDPVQLVEVACADEDGQAPVSLYFVIPAVGG